jgi:hypothetical protein
MAAIVSSSLGGILFEGLDEELLLTLIQGGSVSSPLFLHRDDLDFL